MYGLRRQRPAIALLSTAEYNKKERRAPSTIRKSAERRAPSAERRAPSAERRAPSASPLAELLPSRRGGPPSTETASAGRPPGFARPRAARRSPVRSAGALAAVALLALSGALALPATAEAQTATTLVSNIAQSADGNLNLFNKYVAQPFTTGSHPTGYVLTGVDVVSASSTGFTAQVCGANTNGTPTSTCTDLTAPDPFAVGTMSFTAPTNTTLSMGTTYVLFLTAAGDSQGYGYTDSDAEDAGKAAGWSIANTSRDTEVSGAWGTEELYAYRIAIKGSTAGNAIPVYATSTATRTVPENSAAGTDVGDPIHEATDAEDDTLTYSMGGTDAASFAFDASTRQITTIANVDYNHEAAQNSYSVTVTATDAAAAAAAPPSR